MTGFVVGVRKEEEWTSHDAVQRLRTVLGIKEIGHAGSLDPFATGVLVCGVGRGTKILSYLMDLPKDYVGLMRLGVSTDSGDPTGEVVDRRPVGTVAVERAREIASLFLGEQDQIPPMISAIKHRGKRLYELARAGIEIERSPRRVEVHAFEILGISGELLEFRVLCGKGTYVRSLARDFGEALGTGAIVEQLRRRAVGPFDEEHAISVTGEPDQVRAACASASVTLGQALSHVPSLRLRPEWVRRVRQGEQPPWRAIGEGEIPERDRYSLLGPEGELVALASLEAVPGPIDRPWRDCWQLKLERVI